VYPNIQRYIPEHLQDSDDISFGEKLKSAFVTDNEIGAAIARENGLPDIYYEGEYNALDDLTEDEKLDENFVFNAALADSPSQLESVRRQTEKERKHREKLTGVDGVAASMIAGTLSPINFIPVGGQAYRAYKSGKVMQGALYTAAVGAGTVSSQEALLHTQQLERTQEETLINITAAMLISGALGGGTAKLNQIRSEHPTFFDEVEEILDDELPIEKSVGAAQAFEDVEIKGKNIQKASKGLSYISPLDAGLSSKVPEVRNITARLSESPYELIGGQGQSVEQLAKTKRDAYIYRGLSVHKQAYVDYKKAGGKMSNRQFNERVTKEMRNPVDGQDEFIKRSADNWRAEVYDPIKKDLIELKMLGEDVDVSTAANYVNRRWDREKVAANINQFQRIVSDWLQSRQEFETPEDADDLALEIAGRIMKTPDGILPYDHAVTASHGGKPNKLKGVFKSRVFDIEDELIEDFLENDIEALSSSYVRQTVADAELVRAFGGQNVDPSDAVMMQSQIGDIEAKYRELLKKETDPTKAKKLKSQGIREVKAIVGMRDRIRGTYDLPDDPMNPSIGRRIHAAARNLNFIRLMGGVVPSSFPDVARINMAEGFIRAHKDGLIPLLRNLKGFKINPEVAEDFRYWGIGAETYTNGRIDAIADITDYNIGKTKVEKSIEYLSNHFGNISLMNQWTDSQKIIHGLAMQARVFDELKAGKFKNPKLEKLGIDEFAAKDIFNELKKHSIVVDGARIFNAREWDNQDLAFKWGAALRKESDRVIIVPGQEKPLVMSRDLGKTILQFRSFMVSSTQRALLAGLQGQDASFFSGMTFMIGLGMMTTLFKSWNSGREYDFDPDDPESVKRLVMDGIDRSGAMGILMEANNTAEKLTGNRFGFRPLIGIDQPASRFASRSFAEAAIGPSYGSLVSSLSRVANSATDENEWKDSDTKAFLRLLPYNNLFYLRRASHEISEAAQ
jgi:hypothetical protein